MLDLVDAVSLRIDRDENGLNAVEKLLSVWQFLCETKTDEISKRKLEEERRKKMTNVVQGVSHLSQFNWTDVWAVGKPEIHQHVLAKEVLLSAPHIVLVDKRKRPANLWPSNTDGFS